MLFFLFILVSLISHKLDNLIIDFLELKLIRSVENGGEKTYTVFEDLEEDFKLEV